MLAVVILVALLAAIALAIVASPLGLHLVVQREASVKITWRIVWLYGLLRFVGGRPRELAPAEAPSEKAEPTARSAAIKKARRSKRRPAGRWLAVARTRGLVPRILKLVRDLLSQVEIKAFYANGEFGLDDPADTGALYGVLSPALYAAAGAGYDVSVRPDFLHPGGILQARA